MLCIICREEKQDMSDEHVVPDSLGGHYHIYTVCRTCNSEMGDSVDSPLVNHKLSELYRFGQELAGKSGKVPNPFSGVFVENDNPASKARVDIRDGKLDLVYLPLIKIHKKEGNIDSIEIAVDPRDDDKIDEILKKLVKRQGIPESALVRGERRREVRYGGIGGKWNIDILKFKIGLLKIAYEFAIDNIPQYFNDPDAVKISKILKGADYDGALDYVKFGSGLDPEVFTPFAGYLDADSKKHYMVLFPHKSGLLCIVKLHDLFSIGVFLSKEAYIPFKAAVVGINDIDGGTFRKLSLFEAIQECLGPTHTRFLYYFPYGEEKSGSIEVSDHNFRYLGQGGDVPLHRKDGTRYPFSASDLCETSVCSSSEEGSLKINLFHFDSSQQFFIRSIGSGNLIQVLALETSAEQVRKI